MFIPMYTPMFTRVFTHTVEYGENSMNIVSLVELPVNIWLLSLPKSVSLWSTHTPRTSLLSQCVQKYAGDNVIFVLVNKEGNMGGKQ